MRAYVCGETGTDTWLTVPLDPPVFNPDTGVDQTTVYVWDGLRPEYPPTAGCSIKVAGRNPTQELWLVIDWEATSAPAGTFDLGDPSSPTWQSTSLTNPEKNYLTQTFPEGDMDTAQTRGDVLRVIKVAHETVVAGVAVGWGDV